MIEHIVLVAVPKDVGLELRQQIIASFRSFAGRIEGVVDADAGEDFSGRCDPYSIAAAVRLRDRAALDAYATHPAHVELVRLLDELGARRLVADFERQA